MTPVQQTVVLGTKLRLSYVDLGDSRSKEVLVLLPGLSDSWRSWELVLRHLPTSLRVIAVSQRGHGESDKPDAGYSVRDYARDLEALLEALGLARVVVAGHSSASLVARRFAMEHRERVAGVVLEGSFVRLAGPAVEAAGRRIRDLTDPIDPAFVRDFAAGTFARPVDQTFVEAMIAESLKVPARVWSQTFRSLLDDDDLAELATLEAPTLIVWGDQDAIVDRAATDALVRAVRSSRLVQYHGVGHTAHWEVPEQFARDVAAFVVECGRPR
ncbi:MAG: alpha/beta hydrolase [Deltaproteobacteria bacterium]|nr:alpha/beta hydrolase [Deltaproteobacteria bacterium]